jgi:hypothetical protein
VEAQRRSPQLDQLPFWLWLSAHRRKHAEESEQRLSELERRAPRLLTLVAEEHVRGREFDAAWTLLDRLEQRAGPSCETECERGRVRELEGRRIEAASHYERALRIEPGSVEARDALRRMREAH